MEGIFHHLGVETIKIVVRDCVFDHNKPILVKASDSLFQVPWTETTILKLVLARLDCERMGRGKPPARSRACTTGNDFREEEGS